MVGCARRRWYPASRIPSAAVWLTVRLTHPNVARVDRGIGDARSGAISAAAGTGQEEAVCFRAFTADFAFSFTLAVVLHACPEASLLPVVGTGSLELH